MAEVGNLAPFQFVKMWTWMLLCLIRSCSDTWIDWGHSVCVQFLECICSLCMWSCSMLGNYRLTFWTFEPRGLFRLYVQGFASSCSAQAQTIERSCISEATKYLWESHSQQFDSAQAMAPIQDSAYWDYYYSQPLYGSPYWSVNRMVPVNCVSWYQGPGDDNFLGPSDP